MGRKKKEYKQTKVIMITQTSDLDEACHLIKENYVVIINVSKVKAKSRFIDFLTGFIVALNGKREKLEENIYSFEII